MTKILEAKAVSEAERAAAEAAIAERLGPDAPQPVSGAAGNSPDSSETVVFMATGAHEHGARVALTTVCKSHDGRARPKVVRLHDRLATVCKSPAVWKAEKGPGRWRTVCIAAPKADGDLAVCAASDRDAEEVGSSGFYVRPWTTHQAEQASNGLGWAQDAMASAFAVLGL